MKIPTLRKWQTAAYSAAETILITENKGHMYVQAPTGSGKSRFMFEVCEHLPVEGVRVIIVGLSNIVIQHRDSFLEMGCKPVSYGEDTDTYFTPSGNTVIITTWQTYRNTCETMNNVAVVLFDEVHLGGTRAENKSYRKIMNRSPSKFLFVSATIQNVSEELLGPKEDHTYIYTMAEAYEDGILNEVSLVEVHTGTKALIAKAEKTFGKNIEDLEVIEEFDIQGLAKSLRKRKVGIDMKDVALLKKLLINRHIAMMEIYFAQHAGQAAIFYTPSIAMAVEASLIFNKMSEDLGHDIDSSAVHSQDHLYADEIKGFRTGKPKVLFVVNMLQEGFDMPSLAIAFDCRFHRQFNKGRIVRLIQKIGRLCRLSEGKAISRYYFARDLFNYAKDIPDMVNTVDQADLSDDLVEDFEVETLDEDIESLGITAAKILSVTDGQTDGTVEVGNVTETKVNTYNGKSVRLSETPLYWLRNADGHNEVKTISFNALWSDTTAKKDKLLAMARAGEDRPKKGSTLALALNRYSDKNHVSFDPIFSNDIRDTCDEWFRSKSKDQKQKNMISQMAKNGEDRPSLNTKLGKILTRVISKHQKSFDAKFKSELLTLRPDWFGRGRKVKSPKRQILLDMARNGKPKPKANDPLGVSLRGFLNKRQSADAVEFASEMKALRPDWFKA